ncbi:efflux RND transporter periplasmic adaptor subunit [Aestuariibius sp. 2305UL40-4]|uniref:efflux RND transporter periplasmic adaptor subunit n=1 Tax=Aestuariibius violaceus TaxID=3234132 RepID=UPI00345E578D
MAYLKAPALFLSTLILAGCWEEEAAAPESEPRMVRTVVAETADPVRTRSFPAVLQPPELTPLAFDVGGRLGPVDLRIGQEIAQGDVLATVEAEDAALRLQQAQAAHSESETAASNARQEADRQVALYDRNVVSEAARDRALTQADQADARVTQAARNLDLVQSTLGDTTLRAPFDGIIDGINVQAFGSVQPGQPVLTLYEDTGLQATILVSFEVVTTLELGQSVSVVPTDGAGTPLPATLTEIGRRAAAVSSFPIVVTLDQTRPELRSGMAVEVLFDLPIPKAQQAIELPLSSIALSRDVAMNEAPFTAQVFVALPVSDDRAELELTDVTLGTVAKDLVYITGGLATGDRVVTAGVSFLNPGQIVRVAKTGDVKVSEASK